MSYNSCRTCVTNHMRYISHHITPLVNNSLEHKLTNMYTDDSHRINLKIPRAQRPAHVWFENWAQLKSPMTHTSWGEGKWRFSLYFRICWIVYMYYKCDKSTASIFGTKVVVEWLRIIIIIIGRKLCLGIICDIFFT